MKQHLLKNSFLRGFLCLLLCIVGIGNAWGEEVTVTFDASKQGYTNAQTITDVTITDGISVTFTKGTASPAYYTSGTAIRCYAKGSFTITSTIGDITKIVFTYGSSDGANAISTNVGTFDKNTWTGSESSVKFTIGGTTGNRRIKTITVTYVVDTSITYSIIDRHDSGTNREYYVGDTPTADGLALIDNSEQEITEGVTWSFEPQTIQEETMSVTASAEYQGVKRAEYTYNITNKGTRTLSSIEIGGTPSKTSYHIGDTPSAEGLTVNAVYSNGSKADVTDDVTWTFNPETLTEEGNIEVTATAEYQDKSVSYTYNVIVTKNPKITDYTKLEDGKKYYIVATLSNGTDYYFSTTYTTITDAVKGVAQTDKANANILTAIANSSDKTKWAFQFGNGYYLSLKDSQDNGKVRIIAQKTYWVLSNTTKGLINMTTNGFCLQRNISSGTTNFGSYKNTQTDIWFIEVPTYDVEISSAGYATFCLPYDATVPEGLKAYTATDNGETVKLTAIENGKIAAGEGVVLHGEAGTYTFVATAEDVSATAGNQMVGVTEDTELNASDNAYLLTRDKNTQAIAFRKLATTYTLGTNKAYLKLDNGSESRQLISVVWDDNATGIYDLSEKKEENDGTIYNLAGQKLTRTQKGINIINGKLVIK